MWRCPVCAGALELVAERRWWRCADGHSFDVAREGYVNLLVTHQRRARPPGDTAEMVRCRRSFLDGGWYAPLHDALARHAGRGATLDAGCGEGYYTRGWPELSAIDISKAAVRLAARRATPGQCLAVASVYATPVPDESFEVVLSVFAPLHSPELERVLRPGGRLVTVTPGPRHLEGLAALLFDEVEPHPEEGPFERVGATTALRPVDHERVRYDLHLDRPDAIAALLGMTPWSWYVGEEVRARVRSRSSLSTPVDFVVSHYAR